MEILQGSINRDNYYSVKESAEILGVTTKTIRNRIEHKTLNAVWYELGRGQSQWLIPKNDIKAIVDKEVNTSSRQLSIPAVILDEIKAQIRAENETVIMENKALRSKINELIETQEETNKTLQELITAIQQGGKKLPWYRRLW